MSFSNFINIHVHPEQYYQATSRDGLSNSQPVSGYKRWNVRRRADGINETFKSKTDAAVRTGTAANNLSALPVALTVQGGMGTSGGDTVLDYYDPDGVNDYIGPTLSATQMNNDSYGRALSYDSDAFAFYAGDAVGIWVCTKDGTIGNPLIGWGNCFNAGCGIFWNPSSTSGTLSVISNDYEFETVPYSQLRYTTSNTSPYWNYILWDSQTGKIFINGEEAAYRAGSYGYDGSSGDSREPDGNPAAYINTSGHGWLPTPDQIGPDSNQGWESGGSPGSGIEYLEIGRAMKDNSSSNPPWNFSSYVKATTNTFFGEVHVWAQSSEGVITRGPLRPQDLYMTESVARYFHNITLSAGQLGYYHAQTL
tara:strand:+ start:18 stop:1112 length:1095 start_codon:yes stop_codon:yes gene_type:complete